MVSSQHGGTTWMIEMCASYGAFFLGFENNGAGHPKERSDTSCGCKQMTRSVRLFSVVENIVHTTRIVSCTFWAPKTQDTLDPQQHEKTLLRDSPIKLWLQGSSYVLQHRGAKVPGECGQGPSALQSLDPRLQPSIIKSIAKTNLDSALSRITLACAIESFKLSEIQ